MNTALGLEIPSPLDVIKAAHEAAVRVRIARLRKQMLLWGSLGVGAAALFTGITAAAAFKVSGAPRAALPGLVFGGMTAAMGFTGLLIARAQITPEALSAPNEPALFFTTGWVLGR